MYVRTNKDRAGLAYHLLRAISQVPLVPTHRSQALSAQAHRPIDDVLERLRYVAVRRVLNDRRLDQFVTPEGKTKAAPANEVLAALLKLFNARRAR